MAFDDTFGGEVSKVNLESHTPDTGTAWTLQVGTAGSATVLSTGGCQLENASDFAYTCDDQGTDALIYVKVSGFGARQNSLVCPVIVDETNCVGWRNFGTGSSGRRLTKVIAGTSTDLITSQPVSDEFIKVERSGTTYKLFEGGTGGTPSWTQVGTDQTVTNFSTEQSQGIRGSDNVGGAWITEFHADALSAGTSINATSQALILTEQNATVTVSSGTTVEIGQVTETDTAQAVTVFKDIAAIGQVTETDTAQAVSLGTPQNISATSQSLVITEQSATINAARGINATSQSLTLTEQQATVNAARNVSATSQALTLTEFNATISIGLNIQATSQALTLTEQNAAVNASKQIQAASQSLTLTEFNATVSINNAQNINATSQSLTLTEQNASVNAARNIQATKQVLTLNEFNATVSATVVYDIAATRQSLILTSYRATIASGATVSSVTELSPIFKVYDWKTQVNRVENPKPKHYTYEFSNGRQILEDDDYDPYNR